MMTTTVIASKSSPRRTPWNKGKLIGTKPPLRLKHVWAIRSTLQLSGRTRDLALFNLGIARCEMSGGCSRRGIAC